MALSTEDKALLKEHLEEAKKCLRDRQFQDYWTAVNKASGLLGGADGSEEHENETLNTISQKLGGPPWD